MIKIAWRNIWRNRRRALLTMSSVFFAVFFCILMMGFNEGQWDRMIDNTLKTQTGHIQIHDKAYWEDKIMDNFMFMDAATISQLEHIEYIENVSPRIETFALASYGTVNKGIAILGVSPTKEAQKSNLSSRIIKGEYLSENDEGILMGEGMRNYLKVSIGDTVALIGQGYHGASAAQLFPVRGILKMLTPEMDNSLAYITLQAAQKFIDMPDGYTGILISITDNNKLEETIRKVEEHIDTQTLDVYSWHFTMERLLQTAQSDQAFAFILMFIMYVIVGFGILGTIIMMTNERKREFCVMISLGMSRIKLATVVAVELLMMSLLGVILALVVTLPIAHWFAAYPIKLSGSYAEMFAQYGMEPLLPMSVRSGIFIGQVLIVSIIALLTMIYPIVRILKLKITSKE